MPLYKMKGSEAKNGFTLVELAIVLMIIGLLIGGVLKGQELIQNARIISLLNQNKSFNAAILTFMDAYGAKPGDITNPATRLPNCSAAPCSNAGNGDGIIGGATGSFIDENNTTWAHLSAANLLSGVDTAQWATDTVARMVTAPLNDSNVFIRHYNSAPDSNYVAGIYGHWYMYRRGGSSSVLMAVPVNIIGRIDNKIDNGHPFTGEVMLGSVSASCGAVTGTTNYDANNATPCVLMIIGGF